MVQCGHASILHRYEDMASQKSASWDTTTYSLKHSIENCGQTAVDEVMVSIDRLQQVASALSDGTIADLLQLTVYSHDTAWL